MFICLRCPTPQMLLLNRSDLLLFTVAVSPAASSSALPHYLLPLK